jgi:ribosomal-protein-alanine N-acetyltransferase
MLETNRLILRVATLEDTHLLFQLNSDPEVVRYTGDASFTTMLEAQNIIRERMIFQFKKYKMTRFMTFLKDGTFIGWCGLKYFPENNEVDLGYRFLKNYWGEGYATEASKVCLKYGFETLALPRIIAKAMPDNIGSIKVMQKLGMTFKGYVKDPTDPQSFILYEMNKKDYQKCEDY